MESRNQNTKSRAVFLLLILVIISVFWFTAVNINKLKQQLDIRDFQIVELKRSIDKLEYRLQVADLKIAALTGANAFLEKNNNKLGEIKDSLQNQFNLINNELGQQQGIADTQQNMITSLNDVTSKLDAIISQLGYLYSKSISTTASSPKSRKQKVDVFLSPAKENSEK